MKRVAGMKRNQVADTAEPEPGEVGEEKESLGEDVPVSDAGPAGLIGDAAVEDPIPAARTIGDQQQEGQAAGGEKRKREAN
jgi:hypothetical protein